MENTATEQGNELTVAVKVTAKGDAWQRRPEWLGGLYALITDYLRARPCDDTEERLVNDDQGRVKWGKRWRVVGANAAPRATVEADDEGIEFFNDGPMGDPLPDDEFAEMHNPGSAWRITPQGLASLAASREHPLTDAEHAEAAVGESANAAARLADGELDDVVARSAKGRDLSHVQAAERNSSFGAAAIGGRKTLLVDESTPLSDYPAARAWQQRQREQRAAE